MWLCYKIKNIAKYKKLIPQKRAVKESAPHRRTLGAGSVHFPA